LLDKPVTAVFAVMGSDGRPNLTPMWFDYEGDTVLVNVASHRKKVDWIRANGEITILLMNPENPYHWVSLKVTVEREVSEDDPEEGARVTAQLDRIWTKYTQAEPPYGLRDPAIDERRVLFECRVDRVATFGKP
ncbi:MAG: pyridoxamine 5'-phosphate oxidase family protein, partial [Acidimicrobiia bacterium]|nr:pyridoxamine 5'-phosphate oxidase family protein [Acidimicrobiia bacterium]